MCREALQSIVEPPPAYVRTHARARAHTQTHSHTRTAPGEELTVTYVDAALPRQGRRELLHWAYGFRCRCRRCLGER